MSKPANKKAPKRKAANGYKLPDPIPAGEILTDITKQKWVTGPSIGVGGFGEIYSAKSFSETSKKTEKYNYVVKIEPHENGPLFVEMHFYIRNAKVEDINIWKSKKKLSYLGMPKYIGSGTHECNGEKYRFLVMERFGQDLWSIFLESERIFPIATVFRIGCQVLNVLEYMHSRGYVHADIKGANILLNVDVKLQCHTYLVDFGLASHFTTKDFKPDPKKAHNGTIEYTSRDAHEGVMTRRGDIEILMYNMFQWLGNKLPWEDRLSDPVKVQKAKEEFLNMNSLNGFKNITDEFLKLFKYVKCMKYDTVPDYQGIHTIFMEGIKNHGGSNIDAALLFTTPPTSKNTRKTNRLKDIKSSSEKVSKRTSKTNDKIDTSSSNISPLKTAKRSVEKLKKVAKLVNSAEPSTSSPKRKAKQNLKETIENITPNRLPRIVRKAPKFENPGMFNLEDLSGSDDDYEPSTKTKIDNSEPKRTRNYFKKVEENDTPTRKSKKKSPKFVKEDDDDSKLIRTRQQKVETVPSSTPNSVWETSDSDMFASFDSPNINDTLNKYHPKNIPPSECGSSSDDNDTKQKLKGNKTSKRKLDIKIDNNNIKVTRKTKNVKKGTKPSWKDFPTVKNGRSVKIKTP